MSKLLSLSLIAALLSATVAACSVSADEVQSDEAASTTADAEKGALSAADEDGLYHWSEGSEFLPYFALRAMKVLERDATGQLTGKETDEWLLSEKNLERHGFIADDRPASRRTPDVIVNDAMPDGTPSLPIGMTLSRAADTGLMSVGVNCAACHVAQIEIDGKRQVVPGAPNMLEVGRFFGEAVQTLGFLATAASPETKSAFATRLTAEAARTKTVFAKTEDEALHTPESADPAGLLFKLVGPRAAFESYLETLDAKPEQKALLSARKVFFEGLVARTALAKSSTAQGFGRTDAFGTAKNMIFFGEGFMQPTHAPMSFPSMFNMETIDLFHANANTNSVLERNIGQSIGLGAVFAKVGDETVGTMHLTNLLRMEHAVYKLAPPAWPAAKDADAAMRGEAIYARECKGCHQPKPLANGLFASKRVPLATIGTDPFQLDGLADHVVPMTGANAGKDLGQIFELIVPVFEGVEASYRSRHAGDLEKEEQSYAGSSAEAAKITAARGKASWRTTNASADRAYVARPLDGIWATAPFLHNGSVPTLWDLLQPAKDRTAAFCVGHRTYDLENVGYTVIPPTDGRCPSGDSLLDTDPSKPELKGNSNAGHVFGTTLSTTEKRDLIEFLKGFGAGKARPTILSATPKE